MMLPSTDPLHALIQAARKAGVDAKTTDSAQRCLEEILRRGEIAQETKSAKVKPVAANT